MDESTKNKLDAVGTVRRLLEQAVALGASDLHLDPDQNGVRVTARRDGVLTSLEALPADIAPRLVGRVKALADLLAYRSDVPQEGRIPAEKSGVGREFRVATFPTLHGERVAIRLDAPDTAPGVVADLGLSPDVARAYGAALEQPEGVVLLTGPSGSGKTTTLYAGMRHILAAELKRSVLTLEDPIERGIEGASQSQVDPAAGLTYARALRSLLRQDPDVILLGEIRDAETAHVALEAGLTGHLVATTIHAGTGVQVFARLLEMGIEPFVIAAGVRGVLAQRLVRRKDGDDFAGRVLVAEWLPMTAELRRVLMRGGDLEGLEHAASQSGHRTLQEDAARLVRDGLTTEEEVARVLGS